MTRERMIADVLDALVRAGVPEACDEDFLFDATMLVQAGGAATAAWAMRRIAPRRLRQLAVYVRAVEPQGEDERALSEVPLPNGWVCQDARIAVRHAAQPLPPFVCGA